MKNVIGKWQIVGLKVVQKSGRLVEKDYRKRDLVWEFLPNNEMTESLGGHIHAWHDYDYNSDFGHSEAWSEEMMLPTTAQNSGRRIA